MELSKSEKKILRSYLFRHQDGLVITPIIYALQQKKVFAFIEQKGVFSLTEFMEAFPFFHEGYINVALRSLASQGILTYSVSNNQIQCATTANFNLFKSYIEVYSSFYPLYETYYNLFKNPFKKDVIVLTKILEFAKKLKRLRAQESNTYFSSQVSLHLEGVILSPLLVFIDYNIHLGNCKESDFFENAIFLEILTALDLFTEGKLTPKGSFISAKSYAYGVTVSYTPILKHIEAYLLGDFLPFFKQDALGNEQHVFRGINVWGSGGSHSTYFKKFDTILIDIFNKPLAQQPKGIIDVGCGNGALLEHIFDLIWNNTSRRNDLDKNKLILVGADYNKEALLSTKRNLERANVWAEVVWGDIGNPSEIDRKLQELYNVRLSELINVRSFLDHNRPFNFPIHQSKEHTKLSTGAFAHRGKRIHNADVLQSLVEHFEKWKPYIKNHGLLVIELHTVSPEIVSINLGNTPCTAYDITHGFSDQYIVEIAIFNEALIKAGLQRNENYFHKFPNSDLATISINLIQ